MVQFNMLPGVHVHIWANTGYLVSSGSYSVGLVIEWLGLILWILVDLLLTSPGE